MNNIFFYISEFNNIYGICPCCDELFKLAEASIKFPDKKFPNDPINKIRKEEEFIIKEEEKLVKYEEKMYQSLEIARERHRDSGRKKAKQMLRKIDPYFSGRNVNPQDVKTIFHPIEFITFNGLNSSEYIKNIELVSIKPESKEKELVLKSLIHSIKNGNYKFETLVIDHDGSVHQK